LIECIQVSSSDTTAMKQSTYDKIPEDVEKEVWVMDMSTRDMETFLVDWQRAWSEVKRRQAKMWWWMALSASSRDPTALQDSQEAYRYRQNEANENQQRAGVGLDERACTTRTYTKRNAAKQAKANHVALAFDKPKSLFPEGWAAGVVGVESPGAYEKWQAEAAQMKAEQQGGHPLTLPLILNLNSGRKYRS